ncbi:transposase [Streptomyces vinaceus]|uniref:transposase n=1 Tax=Streptomyces vinaceus TaxID=1960 RepID=UPI0035E33DFB
MILAGWGHEGRASGAAGGWRSRLECRKALLSQSCVPVPVPSNSLVSVCDCLAHRLGDAVDRPNRVRRYPSDITDAQWRVVRDTLPVPARLEGRGGQPEGYCHRQMLDAIFYVADNAIKWRRGRATSPPGTVSMRSSAGGAGTAWPGSSTTNPADGSARPRGARRSRLRSGAAAPP